MVVNLNRPLLFDMYNFKFLVNNLFKEINWQKTIFFENLDFKICVGGFKKMKKYFILTILLFIYVILVASSYTNTVCSDISKNIFRLHVIANSNSEEDQELKYVVRDAILNYINEISPY